ncbi:hypothetical protein [Streptomyces bungoensis]|uniref:hypothetical protein n=1 Tax=Streptomyces bungoensis TaxID=285568 RepID=UPI000A5B4936|nr:hypothetical protein [Streptomyces bungoensis]
MDRRTLGREPEPAGPCEPPLSGATSVGTAKHVANDTEVTIAMGNSDRFSFTLHNTTTAVSDIDASAD